MTTSVVSRLFQRAANDQDGLMEAPQGTGMGRVAPSAAAGDLLPIPALLAAGNKLGA
jgi:hypothetical protein